MASSKDDQVGPAPVGHGPKIDGLQAVSEFEERGGAVDEGVVGASRPCSDTDAGMPAQFKLRNVIAEGAVGAAFIKIHVKVAGTGVFLAERNSIRRMRNAGFLDAGG